MPSRRSDEPGEALVDECAARAVALLRRNLSPGGILAATPGRRSRARGYTAVFGRDAAVCAIGMALSGDPMLEREAARGLVTLAARQAANGQIPKFVDPERAEADFWYLGCIDATLWWLIAVDFVDRQGRHRGFRRRFARRIAEAVRWLRCQEHQGFFLLQQNEASDWADIMPRSGFVLYTNALWHLVKRLYRLPQRAETRAACNQLFHPFSAGLAPYRRARLLVRYVTSAARERDLYLSFVNFSFWGEEGDVFGNLLAIICGLADARAHAAYARSASARGRRHALPRAQRLRADRGRKLPLAAVHGPPPSESPRSVSQRRNLAVHRRLLGDRARGGRPAGEGARGARESRACQRARRLGVQRVAARSDRASPRHARPVVECGGFPDGPSCRAQRAHRCSEPWVADARTRCRRQCVASAACGGATGAASQRRTAATSGNRKRARVGPAPTLTDHPPMRVDGGEAVLVGAGRRRRTPAAVRGTAARP